MTLRIEPVGPDTIEQWRSVHNLIIPATPLTEDEVRERLTRTHLTLAYATRDDGTEVLVGNATIRPPVPDAMTATVIVRILPEYRRRGHGSAYLTEMLTEACGMDAKRIETVILASNEDGLAFAKRHGFVEFDRYRIDDRPEAEFVDLFREP